MKSLSTAAIDKLRARNYRRTPARRITTPAQAQRFVNEVGFCHFWPINGFEMPNLFHAIAGRVRDVPMAHDDPDLSRCWNWKDQALGKGWWYYAKLLGKKATLVSLEFLPAFFALSPNFGDEDDYLLEYQAGALSREAKEVYEVVRAKGPIDTVRLRRDAHLASDSAKAAFERALVELQAGMKIVPAGVAEAGAWRYAFTYDLLGRQFPDAVQQARALSRGEARARLVSKHVSNVVAASQADIARTFRVLKWTATELNATLSQLEHSGVLAQVPGDEVFVLARALRK